jgi:hypothetical protein
MVPVKKKASKGYFLFDTAARTVYKGHMATRGRPKKPGAAAVMWLRIPDAVVNDIDAYATELAGRFYGTTPTRADAVRNILLAWQRKRNHAEAK